MKAAETVYADEIIRRMPKAYETMVLERGSTLSAGERQLIAPWQVRYCSRPKS